MTQNSDRTDDCWIVQGVFSSYWHSAILRHLYEHLTLLWHTDAIECIYKLVIHEYHFHLTSATFLMFKAKTCCVVKFGEISIVMIVVVPSRCCSLDSNFRLLFRVNLFGIPFELHGFFLLSEYISIENSMNIADSDFLLFLKCELNIEWYWEYRTLKPRIYSKLKPFHRIHSCSLDQFHTWAHWVLYPFGDTRVGPDLSGSVKKKTTDLRH